MPWSAKEAVEHNAKATGKRGEVWAKVANEALERERKKGNHDADAVAIREANAAIANIKFPQVPENKAMLGFIIVTYASTFTGGSTALDTATTVYVNTIGAVEPNILP